MNRSLFPVQYEPGYLEAYKLYWSRANMPSADRPGNGSGEWRATRHFRPDNAILLRCIELYLQKIESTKRTRQNGRDSKVEYAPKPHFRKWLRDRTWDDYQERASLDHLAAQMAPQVAQEGPTRRSFKASDLPDPIRTGPLKSRQQILDEHKARQQSP